MRAWDGDYMDDEDEYDEAEQEFKTKAERREAEREKSRYGPITNPYGNYRSPKIRLPRVHVVNKGRF